VSYGLGNTVLLGLLDCEDQGTAALLTLAFTQKQHHIPEDTNPFSSCCARTRYLSQEDTAIKYIRK